MMPLSNYDFTWKTQDLKVFLPVLLTIFTFILYWFTSKSERIKGWFYRNAPFDRASSYHITFCRITGFLVMGVIPTIICSIFLKPYNMQHLGIAIIPETMLYSLYWILGLGVIVIPLAYMSAKKPRNLVNYPQIRAKEWTFQTMLLNAVGWALYLFGYEFLFRGVLLFPLAEQLGVWPAISVNIALYSATHVPKGLDETIGAIPLGLVLCLLTLTSGTIWIAFWVHVMMAWTNSFTAFKFHPDMKYKKAEK